jgi:amidase
MRRRDFLHASVVAGAGAVGARASSEDRPFELAEATIGDLQRAMERGERSSRSIVDAYLERIEALDRSGPSLGAIIETNPDARSIAESLDEERRARGARGPLHGIPVLLKDNVDTADSNTTTAGSLALEGSRPARDSHVAERLRAAGAVLLGKANMSEWANFRSSRSSSGWSARGGQCRNPYALDRSPSGSSSGSGVAVSANLCAVAVGTETDGSIISPSANCGIVGIKPTLGLVSRAGIIPIAHSQDTAGPMARTVADAAALLAAMAGPDPRDAVTTAARKHVPPRLAEALDPKGLAGARIGVIRSSVPRHEGVGRELGKALDAMRALGATIVDPADLPAARGLDAAELEVLLFEFKADLNAYFASLGPKAPIKSIKDLIAFNEKHRDREMPYFGQEYLVMAAAKGPLTDPAYRRALATSKRLAGPAGIDAALKKHRVDALVTPSNGPSWLVDYVNGDSYTGGNTTPAAVSGYPSITVPMGFVGGLPVGLSFLGPAWSEARLVRYAYAFEQGTRARRAPAFARSADPRA